MSDQDEKTETINADRRKMFNALSLLAGGAVLSGCAPTAGGSPQIGALAQELHGDATVHYADLHADLLLMHPGVQRRFCILSGYWSRGDGGGGLFYWDATQPIANANGGTIIAPTGSSLGCWMRIFDGEVSVKWFGATSDGLAPPSGTNVAAFTAAIHSLSPTVLPLGGGVAPGVFVPPGTYLMTSTLVIDRTLILRGAGGGYVAPATTLKFTGLGSSDDGVQVYLQAVNPPAGSGRGDFSVIRDLCIRGDGGGAHAVRILARARVEGCYLTAFGGDGIHIEAGVPASNANGWHVGNLRIDFCGRHGLYVVGDDANAGSAVDVDVGQCLGWGIYDSSFLGNTYIACQVDSVSSPAGMGPYKSDSATATNLFLGCYSEGAASPPAPGQINEIVSPSMVLGGVLSGSSLIGNGGVLAFSGPSPIFLNGSWVQARAQFENPTPTVSANFGGQSVMRLVTNGNPDLGLYTTLDYGSLAPGWWSMRHEANVFLTPFAFSTYEATEEGPGQFWMPNGYYIGSGAPYYSRIRVYSQQGSTPPAYDGTPGMRVLNATPQPGGWEGYIWCDGVGWKGFGLIQS